MAPALPRQVDVLVIGAGAAGMMCAIEAGKRGRSVLVVDHADAPGEKIRISGGGRCNFTNLGASPKNYLSQNPRFAISALARYTQHDFIALVDRHRIAWHEKTLGQLFCDGSAKQIIAMLVDEMDRAARGSRSRPRSRTSPMARPASPSASPAARCAAPRWCWPPAASPSRRWAPPASPTRSPSASA